MQKFRLVCAALIVAMVVPTIVANDSWWADVYEQKTVNLSDIIRAPRAFKGIDVSFVIQFNAVGSIDNPFYTRFEKDQFVNFSAWGDDTALWDKEEYGKNFPYLFIDRIKTASKTILEARQYDRFVVTGRVDSVFRGQPWIEITGLEKLEEKITEPSLIRLVKAHKLKSHRRFSAAAAELHLADAKTLPLSVRHMVLREQGTCLAAEDRWEEAVTPLTAALKLTPDDKKLAEMVDHCQSAIILAKKKKEKSETPPKVEESTEAEKD